MSVVHLLSRIRFCNPLDCSTPGLPVLYYLPEFALTHVHWAADAIQPSHLLLPPSAPVLSLSQHQGLFQWVSSLHQVTEYWSFSFRINPSNEYSGLISSWLTGSILQSKGLSRVSPAPQFKSINSSALSLLYCPTLTSTPDYWKNRSLDYTDLCQQRDVSALLVFMYLDAPLLGALCWWL